MSFSTHGRYSGFENKLEYEESPNDFSLLPKKMFFIYFLGGTGRGHKVFLSGMKQKKIKAPAN